MPWKEHTTMSLRHEFVTLAIQDAANISALCRHFSISRQTAYKWIRRYLDEGPQGLEDRSRRPDHCPHQTPDAVEQAVLEVATTHRAWGGRKIRKWLLDRINEGTHWLCGDQVPAASTISTIRKRYGLISPAASAAATPYRRFERAAPNELWQMDFKGYFVLLNTQTCHPLTVLDDHSRFALALEACADETAKTVKRCLSAVLRRYGLPERILCDNGPPWGVPQQAPPGQRYWTEVEAWLIRLGIGVSHGRPHHPQTQGKDERFHRTLKAEVLRYESFGDHGHCQERFDAWRDLYNLERPHEALGLDVPAAHYQVSPRRFPEVLPALVYGPDDRVRKVDVTGRIRFQGQVFRVGKAFRGQPVALRPSQPDGVWSVYYWLQEIKVVDLLEADGP